MASFSVHQFVFVAAPTQPQIHTKFIQIDYSLCTLSSLGFHYIILRFWSIIHRTLIFNWDGCCIGFSVHHVHHIIIMYLVGFVSHSCVPLWQSIGWSNFAGMDLLTQKICSFFECKSLFEVHDDRKIWQLVEGLDPTILSRTYKLYKSKTHHQGVRRNSMF